MEEGGKGCVAWKRGNGNARGETEREEVGVEDEGSHYRGTEVGEELGWGRGAESWWGPPSGPKPLLTPAQQEKLQQPRGSRSLLQTAGCRALPHFYTPPTLLSVEALLSLQLKTLLSSAPLYLLSLLALEAVREPSSHTGF